MSALLTKRGRSIERLAYSGCSSLKNDALNFYHAIAENSIIPENADISGDNQVAIVDVLYVYLIASGKHIA